MQGHFDVQLKEAGGLKDEDFKAAIRAGTINDVLASLETKQRAAAWNQLMHWIVPTYFHNVFGHAFPNGPWPTYDACVWCNNISLMITDSEPVYNYEYGWYGGYHAHFDNIGTSTGSKGMQNEAIGRVNEKLPGGREGVYLMTRFLFLPSQGNSNNIRSLGLFGSQYTNQGTGSEDRYISGRVRLKDPGTGLPTIIVKNLNQVLVIEYTIYWIAI